MVDAPCRAALGMLRQIEATDAQIDALVYELYGLTDEEIATMRGRE
jgi:hypothetical protein